MRADLLALTPEKVATLANLGLVKRAQKEIAAGQGPQLEEAADGTVIGRFADGVVAKLPPGVPLRECPCTCNASTACRHRVAVALAYAAWHGAQAAGAPSGAQAPAPSTKVAARSPGAFTDEALRELLGKRDFERARAAARAGQVVEIHRGSHAADGVSTARLSTCTVRFLVPDSLAYARCDCAVSTGCEHLAIAVWAFREADAKDAAAPMMVIQLGGQEGAGAGPREEAAALGRELLVDGVVHAGESFAQRFARARAALDGAGMVWPGRIVEELEDALERYRQRSARYGRERVASLLAELEARSRAAASGSGLPPRFLLGSDEARETLLDHVRLVSLGARLTGEEGFRAAEVYLADPDTGMVLLLRKEWTYADGEAPLNGSALAERTVLPRVTLGLLAHGTVVSKGVRRLADRRIVLSTHANLPSTVSRQTGDWGALPAPIRIETPEAYRAAIAARPPRLLRPRWLAEDVHVVEVVEVRGVRYAPGAQELTAALVHPSGQEVWLARRYRACAPAALDVLAAALGAGPVRFVAGELRFVSGRLELDPVALVTDRLVVPDLEPETERVPVELGERDEASSALAEAVRAASGCLDEGAHHGLLRAPPSWPARLEEAARRLEEAGLVTAAARMREAAAGTRRLQAAGGEQEAVEAARAWLGAAIRLELTRERL